MKQRIKTVAELTGVRGDSARGKNSRSGTWETRRSGAGSEQKRDAGMHNRMTCTGRESDRLIVARKRVTTVERRGLSVDVSR